MKKIKSRQLKGAAFFTALFLVILALFLAGNPNKIIYMTYNRFIEHAENRDIENVTLTEGAKFTFRLNGGDTVYETDNPRNMGFKEYLLKNDIAVTEGKYVSADYIIQTSVSVLFFCGAGFMAYKMLSKQSGKAAMGLNAKQAGDSQTAGCGFLDVAGNDEAKESVWDIVDFIKNPGKYAKYGARMPRGVIFYGPPGTGKTLMAKAIAGEAGVPFYAVSGSDFVQMYVGVGASRVRELFKKAREHGKAVIFIDEVDALGKKRASSAASGNDEREQTLNALLTEMSGFGTSEGIVVIAATNRLDTLDEALLRPGRFDRQVEIGLPDFNGREKILTLHAKNKPLSEDVSMAGLARQTVYFSGAMLENLLNEAAICAAKKGSDCIESSDIDTAYYTVIAGSEKKDRSAIKQTERKITAYHESGHALAAKILSPENLVSKITIIPSSKGAGGFCVNIPPDKMYYTKKELEAQVIVSLAGRAAEEIIFGGDNVTTGASNDIEKATAIIKDYVTRYGMSGAIGLINTGITDTDGGKTVFEECAGQMERLYNEAKSLINSNIHKLHSLSAALLEKETLNEEEIEGLVA